ncbi:hypothetical protein CRI94_07200 [Longibacter salinarum]|uniref:Uncharacterized protein n=1 Tax=Longibacter salinarum TaxID=1850348 RepID=A0A2A8CZ14_9BACT|nr:hypothetical protein [Longibacter salinarum]PEN13841.1 hypothetical protein CRI94_07200 [Longibacter salinarum]
MFSGTIFSRKSDPPSSLQLPRSCWAFYHEVDGETSTSDIASDLGLSESETFSAVRLLQSHDLIAEDVVTYDAFRPQAATSEPPSPSSSDGPSATETGGDGVESDGVESGQPRREDVTSADSQHETGSFDRFDTSSIDLSEDRVPTQTRPAPELHLRALWKWMEDLSENVKNYKNTQAFILMEASGALASIGVESMDDLEALEVIKDPEVMEALETAVENNLNESIPESCYQ